MITGLHVKNFKCFEDLRIEKFYGVNLILGVNETGKTSLMKAMYATLEGASEVQRAYRTSINNEMAGIAYFTTLYKTFNINFKTRLELFNDLSNTVYVKLVLKNPLETDIYWNVGLNNNENLEMEFSPDVEFLNGIAYEPSFFVPAKEIMSIYREIQYNDEKLDRTGFDLTYLSIAKALRRSEVGAKQPIMRSDIVDAFDNIFESKVRYSEEYKDFFMNVNGKDLTTPSIAEGIRKTSTIANLLNADEIQRGYVLFIDEPENNLHPRAQRAFMEALVKLSQAGVQVFMASHSYTVLSQLELIAQRDGIDVGCYSLLRDEQTKAIRLASSNLREAMPENDIVTEGIRQLEDSYTLDLQDYGR